MDNLDGILRQITVAPLGKKHDRANFNCWISSLDRYLKQLSGQWERRNLSRTFVAVRPPEPEIMGYYSISTAQVDYTKVSLSQFPRHPNGVALPCILIGKLAVDSQYQKCGLGQYLLMHALDSAQKFSDQIGVCAVLVHAIDETAKHFYEQYGFVELEKSDDEFDLVIGIKAIKKLFR